MISIVIQNFEFDTIIGVLDFERNSPQKVIINCDIEYKYQNKYLDYVQISSEIKNILQTKKFKILEDSLEYICSYLKNKFPNIHTINLEILKPNILNNMIVGAKITKKY